MEKPKISVSWEELSDEKVEKRLRDLKQLKSTREHYDAANVVAPPPRKAVLPKWVYTPVFYFTLFGLIGGLLAGAIRLAAMPAKNPAEQVVSIETDLAEIDRAERTGRLTPEEAERDRTNLREWAAKQVPPPSMRWLEILAAASIGLVAAGVCAAELAAAGNFAAAALRAAVGLLAGIGIALALEQLPRDLIVNPQLTAFVSFALIGAVFGVLVGALDRHRRRMISAGLAGLAIGAVCGFLSTRAAAVDVLWPILLGVGVGIAAGIAETSANVARLRVAEGLIAGKQFNLYREQTFIGAAPTSHVYLFRDGGVGRRHAAIHKLPGGFEIENLPLGGPTVVNDQPVDRARLRHGDRIRIGRTILVFEQEKQA